MALILNLETSTQVCSVALARDGLCLAAARSDEIMSHATHLTRLIQHVLKKTNAQISQLDAVAVSQGPGSYTGLRIGVSAAKGIAYAMDISLIGVPTLQALAIEAGQKKQFSTLHKSEGLDLLCPMIDARRMEVYSALFDTEYNVYREVKAEIISNDSFRQILTRNKVLFFGNGSDKCKDVIRHDNAFFLDEVEASARAMIPLSEKMYNGQDFKDTAYFEPFYLKDFIPTIPKNKLLPG